MSSREGTSVRGGDFGSLSGLATGADVDAAIDASVAAVAARHGVSVDLPSTGGEKPRSTPLRWSEFTSQITGPDGVLASSARLVLDQLGLNEHPAVVEPNADDAAILDRVESELGSDWAKLTARRSTPTRPYCSTIVGPVRAKTSPASSMARTSTSASLAPARRLRRRPSGMRPTAIRASRITSPRSLLTRSPSRVLRGPARPRS